MEGNTTDGHVRMFGFWILCAPLRDDSKMILKYPEFGIVYMVKIVKILKRLDDDWYVWCKSEKIL